MENYKFKFALFAGLIGLSLAAGNQVDRNGNVFISGEDNQVNGKHNVFNGNKNVVTGNSNVVFGDGNIVNGGSNYIQGQNNFVFGGENFVSGSGNFVEDSQAFVMGDNKIRTPLNHDKFFDIEQFTAQMQMQMQKQMQARFKNMEKMMLNNNRKRIQRQI